jgi:hypothetical protein
MYCASCEVRSEFICYVEESRSPLWSSGQSFWLQIQSSAFDSRRYPIFWEVVGLERGPFSLVGTIEELLERNSSCTGLEIREYGRRDQSRWARDTLYPQKLPLTSLTWGGSSVGIVRKQTMATELLLLLVIIENTFKTCLVLLNCIPNVCYVYPYSICNHTGLRHELSSSARTLNSFTHGRPCVRLRCCPACM